MQTTESESKKKNELQAVSGEESTRSSGSGEKSIQTTSSQLSVNLAGHLMGLIKDVNKDGVTPETVNASCNAAAQIYKILRLNFDMKREGF